MASKLQHPLSALEQFLPENCWEPVVEYLNYYKVHLTITKQRRSILGDYRKNGFLGEHRISVNGNLNKYSFLITLLHELAHLVAFEKFGFRIQAHGTEWKKNYSHLLDEFLRKEVFPSDVKKELLRTLNNPSASSCTEDSLIRVLKKYDLKNQSTCFVEDLKVNDLFKTENGRIFRKESTVRKRIKCVEIKTGKVYLFSPVCEISLINSIVE